MSTIIGDDDMSKYSVNIVKYIAIIFILFVQIHSNPDIFGQNTINSKMKSGYPKLKENRKGQWYHSNDFGVTWEKIEIKSLPCKIIDIRFDNTILKSIDSGKTWTKINRISDFDINLYPNPCKDKLTVDCDNSNDIMIGIYDNFGSLIKSALKSPDINLTIEVGDLNRGNYFVGIIDNGKAKLYNLIIE
jgi:hypothetical protein